MTDFSFSLWEKELEGEGKSRNFAELIIFN
jgi:hypothetical protein